MQKNYMMNANDVADEMKWVGLMNSIRSSAEEIVVKELIYV